MRGQPACYGFLGPPGTAFFFAAVLSLNSAQAISAIQTKSVVEILILAIPFTGPHFHFAFKSRLFRNQSGACKRGKLRHKQKDRPEGGLSAALIRGW
jgi:hypothetical protein